MNSSFILDQEMHYVKYIQTFKMRLVTYHDTHPRAGTRAHARIL
jgi:hypothetical protein